MQSIQDRLMADVVPLTANGGRNVGTAGHEQARDYIATRLTEIGVTPYSGDSFLHPYESQGSDFEVYVPVFSHLISYQFSNRRIIDPRADL